MTQFRSILTGAIAATMMLAAPMAPTSAMPLTPAPAPGLAATALPVIQVAQQKQPKPEFLRRKVRLVTDEKPGTIIIDTNTKYLYYVQGQNRAIRYGVGVGREGFGWSGVVKVGRKAEWPDWRPPSNMIARERAKGHIIPPYMKGGPNNPLGARAMYLYKGNRDTIFRIHGTNQPWTIGQNMSSGCIRMMNKDVEHLYEQAAVGSKVIVIGPGSKLGDNVYNDRGIDIIASIFGG